MALVHEIQNHIRAFINIVFPEHCMVCSTPLMFNEEFMCQRCTESISLLQEPLCSKCSTEMPPFAPVTRMCSTCKSTSLHFKQCLAVIRYDDITKRIFHEVKFRKRRNLLHIFDELLYQKLAKVADILKNTIIIPVPLDRRRQREREFNQAALLAKKISQFYGAPYTSGVLHRIKESPPQSLLNRHDRLRNIQGAFRVRPDNAVRSRNVTLVDDVYTTGATVNECARVLRDAGATDVIVFALARTV